MTDEQTHDDQDYEDQLWRAASRQGYIGHSTEGGRYRLADIRLYPAEPAREVTKEDVRELLGVLDEAEMELVEAAAQQGYAIHRNDHTWLYRLVDLRDCTQAASDLIELEVWGFLGIGGAHERPPRFVEPR